MQVRPVAVEQALRFNIKFVVGKATNNGERSDSLYHLITVQQDREKRSDFAWFFTQFIWLHSNY